MGSTLRNDTRRAVFLADLAKAWDRRPDLSFGELLGLGLTYEEREHVAQLDNGSILTAIDRATRHTSDASDADGNLPSPDSSK